MNKIIIKANCTKSTTRDGSHVDDIEYVQQQMETVADRLAGIGLNGTVECELKTATGEVTISKGFMSRDMNEELI